MLALSRTPEGRVYQHVKFGKKKYLIRRRNYSNSAILDFVKFTSAVRNVSGASCTSAYQFSWRCLKCWPSYGDFLNSNMADGGHVELWNKSYLASQTPEGWGLPVYQIWSRHFIRPSAILVCYFQQTQPPVKFPLWKEVLCKNFKLIRLTVSKISHISYVENLAWNAHLPQNLEFWVIDL